MANRKLGIHLAPGALKIVEVEQQAKDLRVLNYSIDYFPIESTVAAQVKILISALKKSKISTKEVNLVISGADIVYKLIEMPEMTEKDLASAIKYKLKAVLPLSFKEVVFDYYKIEKLQGKENKRLCFVAAVSAEKISAAMEIIKAAGLSLRDIAAPSCALKNAAGALVPGPGAIIYLGKYSSLIILVKDGQALNHNGSGQVVFAREAKIGGNDITQAMVGVVQTEKERLELDPKQAEEIKNKYGIPIDLAQYSSEAGIPAAELLAMMRPALEKLSTEILNTFDYYRREIGDEAEFKKVYFSGGASRIKNLLPYFKEQTGLDIEPLPVSVEDPSLALALGAVIAGKDHLSLLPRKGGDFLLGNLLAVVSKELNKWLKYIFMGFAYLLILAAIFGWFTVQQKNLNAEQQALQKKYQEQAAKLGKEAEAARGIIDLTKYSARDRFALVMQELDEITPGVIYLKNLNYDNNENALMLKGIVLEDGGKTSAANFIERLNKSNYFKSVDLVYLDESKLYTVPAYDFELKCVLAGEGKK